MTISSSYNDKDIYQKSLYTANDRRFNVYEVADQRISHLAKSVGCLVEDRFCEVEGDYYILKDRITGNSNFTLAERIQPQFLGKELKIKFSDELAVGCGTAFLVSNQLALTAGHCVFQKGFTTFKQEKGELIRIPQSKTMKLVFDFYKESKDSNLHRIPKTQVYTIKGIKLHCKGEGDSDWALLELDRKIEDRIPLTIDFINPIIPHLDIYMLGYPCGIPLKYTEGIASEKTINDSSSSRADLIIDSFAGNSGSPIFSKETEKVVGMLIEGQRDYVENDGVVIERHYSETEIQEISTGYEKCQQMRTLGKDVIELIKAGTFTKQLEIDSKWKQGLDQCALGKKEEAIVLFEQLAREEFIPAYVSLVSLWKEKELEKAKEYLQRTLKYGNIAEEAIPTKSETVIDLTNHFFSRQAKILNKFKKKDDQPIEEGEEDFSELVSVDFVQKITQVQTMIKNSIRNQTEQNFSNAICLGRNIIKQNMQALNKKIEQAGDANGDLAEAIPYLEKLELLYFPIIALYCIVQQEKARQKIQNDVVLEWMRAKVDILASSLKTRLVLYEAILSEKDFSIDRVNKEIDFALNVCWTKKSYLSSTVDTDIVKRTTLAKLESLKAPFTLWQELVFPPQLATEPTWQEHRLKLQQDLLCILSPLNIITPTQPLGKKWENFLKQIASQAQAKKFSPTCFIFYALSTEKFSFEKWVQPFLSMLWHHLDKAGVQPILDVFDKRAGSNENKYYEHITRSSHILLVATRSLDDAIKRQELSIITELNHIKARQVRKELTLIEDDILPIILSGTIDQIPSNLRHRVPKSWALNDYFSNIKDLLAALYDIGSNEQWYKDLWEEFYKTMPELHGIMKWDEKEVKEKIAERKSKEQLENEELNQAAKEAIDKLTKSRSSK